MVHKWAPALNLKSVSKYMVKAISQTDMDTHHSTVSISFHKSPDLDSQQYSQEITYHISL